MDKYKLPDIMVLADGTKVTEKHGWEIARKQHLQSISEIMLGRAPAEHIVHGEVLSSKKVEYPDGTHSIEEIARIEYGVDLQYSFNATIIRPDDSAKHPVITWNLFKDNARCPIESEVISRGYAIACFDKEQLFHDNSNDRTDAKDAFPEFDWAAIRIWGWAHSKLIDWLEDLDWVDKDSFIATGHSRGGKAALAGAAYDERFKVCVLVNSGCGGAGCYRYLGGRDGLIQDATQVESLGRITRSFPYWFSANLNQYGDTNPPHQVSERESKLPFDLHTLKATIAPRALITLEGLDDTWSNPFGTWLTWKAAQPAFDICGVPGNNNVWYREGGHQFGEEDWQTLLDFSDWALERADIKPYWNNAPFDR